MFSEKYCAAVNTVGCQNGLGRFGIRRTRRVKRGDLRKSQSLSRSAADLVAKFRIGPGITIALIEIVNTFDEKFPHQEGLKCGIFNWKNLSSFVDDDRGEIETGSGR